MDRRRKISAKGPVRLGRIAESLLEPFVAKAGFSSMQILTAWPDIVGPALAARTRPEKLRWPPRRDTASGGEAGIGVDGATLVVRAEGADALEMQYASAEIASRINALFGWRLICRIAIRQGPVAPESRPCGDGAAKGFEEPATDYRADALAEVEDTALREALSRLGSRIKGR